MKWLIKVIMVTLLFAVPSISNATRDKRGYGYPEVEVKNNCFYIYYVDIPYSREFVSVVSSNGYLKELQHDVEVEHKHFRKWASIDMKLGEKYNLAYARREIENDDKLFFQGMTPDCELKMYIINKNSGQVIISKNLGPTTASEHPYSSDMVLADNHIFLAYWSMLGWTIYDEPTYNLVICDWDFIKDTIHVYPIAHIERNYHMTLSMAINNGVLGLAYFECDDGPNRYNRVRFTLIDRRDSTVKKSFWVSRSMK